MCLITRQIPGNRASVALNRGRFTIAIIPTVVCGVGRLATVAQKDDSRMIAS